MRIHGLLRWPSLVISLNILSRASAFNIHHPGPTVFLRTSDTVFSPMSSSSTSLSSSKVTTNPYNTEPSPMNVLMNRNIDSDLILYDGICNFCNTWVDILLRLDRNRKFRFAPLQSKLGSELLESIGKSSNDISSVILISKLTGQFYAKSDCVLKVVEELGPLANMASKTLVRVAPTSIRDSIYDTVAANRYNLMGKREECRCSDPLFADRFILD
jgi:predicted DCC family thiol-disulfide oxidoreductase YuxK